MSLKRQQLVDFVKEKFDIELDVNTFYRTRSGYWQRSNGAWSWTMCYKGSSCDFGSQWSITSILQNKDNVVLDRNELIVENEPQ